MSNDWTSQTTHLMTDKINPKAASKSDAKPASKTVLKDLKAKKAVSGGSGPRSSPMSGVSPSLSSSPGPNH